MREKRYQENIERMREEVKEGSESEIHGLRLALLEEQKRTEDAFSKEAE